ncbi:MAG: hypothetical protein F7C35_06735 [Desulfurococcales archaeon]|nr:hypothetical protein [Desulfurococcales archaeon]
MIPRKALIMVLLAVFILAAALAALYWYPVKDSQVYSGAASLAGNSLFSIDLNPPPLAEPIHVKVVIALSQNSTGPVQVAVVSGGNILVSDQVFPGQSYTLEADLPHGQASVYVMQGYGTSTFRYSAIVTYSIRAIDTGTASYLAPASVIAGFLAGLAPWMGWRANSKYPVRQQDESGESSGEA